MLVISLTPERTRFLIYYVYGIKISLASSDILEIIITHNKIELEFRILDSENQLRN